MICHVCPNTEQAVGNTSSSIKIMTSNLTTASKILTNQSFSVHKERRQLLRTFWIAVITLFVLELFTAQPSSSASVFGAVLIAFAALFPLYLWFSGKALGMPIFPFFALTYLWTCALPLISNDKRIINYSSDDHLFAGATVAGFLGLGTFVWFQFVNSPPALPKSYRVIKGQESDIFFLIVLIAAVLFNMYYVGGWFFLDGGTFALIRGAILGLSVLSVFVLSYRCGTRELSKDNSNLFLLLLVLCIITNAVSLVLIAALSVVLLSAIGFTVGRRKVPWLPIILISIFLLPLHYGKHEMRAKYWGGYQIHYVQPLEYPSWFAEWAGYSIDYFKAPASKEAGEQSFLERANLMDLLLLVQTKTPRDVPYLSGATYAIIPDLLVPRILNSHKIRSHEGTYLLSIHYRLQTRRDTLTTTIGWGLLNEAYANFGLPGCAGIAIILGVVYGQATRWSMNTPLLSSRSLFAVLLVSFAFQTEFSAGVYVSSLFQSIVPLVVITLVLMKVVYSNGEGEGVKVITSLRD